VRGFEPFVDIKTAADFLGVKVSFLYDLASRGKVPSAKVGKYRRFRLSELEAWVKNA
jgi:excisionase family DNA binding protein